jgi:bifunctional non-homologous end joining protein LigD
VIDFPMVQDVASLLWVVNLGCIDLNQWYARCDDVDRPDYLHFDLDPGPGVKFRRCSRPRSSCVTRSRRLAWRRS